MARFESGPVGRTDLQLERHFTEVNWRQPVLVRINKKPNLKDYKYFFVCKFCLYRHGIYHFGQLSTQLPLFHTTDEVESHLAGFHPKAAYHPSPLPPAISPAHPA